MPARLSLSALDLVARPDLVGSSFRFASSTSVWRLLGARPILDVDETRVEIRAEGPRSAEIRFEVDPERPVRPAGWLVVEAGPGVEDDRLPVDAEFVYGPVATLDEARTLADLAGLDYPRFVASSDVAAAREALAPRRGAWLFDALVGRSTTVADLDPDAAAGLAEIV